MKQNAAEASPFIPFASGAGATPGAPATPPSPGLKVMPPPAPASTPASPSEPRLPANFVPHPEPDGNTASNNGNSNTSRPAAGTGTPTQGAARGPRVSATPVVTVQKEGDRVTAIRVECSCGQVIEIGCSY